MTGIERLHEIMVRLRDPEKGCPWDREQTLSSLKPCVLEETYELLAAMDRPEDKANHVEELGDVLLQVMFQAVMAEQEGRFSFDDVANAIADKLVRRHPHVFGTVDAKDAATVLKNWEQIKQMEHKKEARHSALDGVPPTLPGLIKAQRTQEKAARVGFDWKDANGPLAKIEEELGELKAEIESLRVGEESDRVGKESDRVGKELDRVGKGSDRVGKESDRVGKGSDRVGEGLNKVEGVEGDPDKTLHDPKVMKARPIDLERVKAELGDLLFSVCNLARHLHVDSESAVEGTTAKFARRFRAVEAAAKAQGKLLREMTLAEMDALWDAAKRDEL